MRYCPLKHILTHSIAASFFFLAVHPLHATPQVPDYLIYKGKTIPIFTNPLESYLEGNDLKGIDLGCNSSSCSRGYIAIWELIDGKLYLVEIKRCGVIPARYEKVDKFQEGLAAASRDGTYYILNTRGEETPIVGSRVALIRHFSERLAPFDDGSHLGFINAEGKIAIQSIYDETGKMTVNKYFKNGVEVKK